jgi:phenylalanyl-tRNA synthetase beta chain
MKVSLEWISEYVDLRGIDAGKLAEELTVHTAEVDGIIEIARVVDRVVVAKVISAEDIVGPAHAKTVRVDVGGEIINVVCAAPNVRAGVVTAVALPGAILATGAKVEPVEMYGISSGAILCSARELGFGPGHEGIVELPAHLTPGQALGDLVPRADTVLEIDNKSITHRPDLWSHYGFAREIGAIFGRTLAPLATLDLEPFSALAEVKVRIDSADCSFYSAIRFKAGEERPSPLFMQYRLGAVGSRPRNLMIDVTNYVQFEIGQPTHAFDAARVSAIVVANAQVPMDVTSLDGVVRSIAPGDLLIQNQTAPVAIAGIIGGASSEVTSSTREVILESASFSGSRVRMTSMRLGIRTDASQRFEKKLPPILARIAPGRVLRILEDTGVTPELTSRFSTAGIVDETHRRIDIPAGYIASRSGAAIDDSRCRQILESIGFETAPAPHHGFGVTVPIFRSVFDVSTREDISEEVMRLYGYDSIRPELPSARIDSAPLNPVVRNQHRARRMLAQSQRFVEMKTYSWYSAQWLQQIGYTPARTTLDLRNPIGTDRRSMRESLMPNLLAVAEQNRMQTYGFRIFEVGKVFWLDERGVKHEANELCGVIVEQDRGVKPEAIFAVARSAVEDLARVSGMGSLRTEPGAGSGAPWKKTSATVDIIQNQTAIGSMGMVPSALCEKIVGRGKIGWFTIDIDRLAGDVYPATPYRAPFSFPGSTQDFTVVSRPGANYAGLASVLDKLETDVSFNRTFISAYQQDGESVLRYTFRFDIFLPDRTIMAEDINAFRSTLVRHLEANNFSLL